MAMPPPPAPEQPDETGGMGVEQAMALIQQLGIPPEALPQLMKALETLEAAGAIPSDGDEAPAPQKSLDDHIRSAMGTQGPESSY